jgi:hypothetical protein
VLVVTIEDFVAGFAREPELPPMSRAAHSPNL